MERNPYDYLPIPFTLNEERILLTPKSLIQLALSNERRSDLSDSDLADLIERYLYVYMKGNHLSITIDESLDDASLSFSSGNSV